MKKILLTAALISFVALTLFAQELSDDKRKEQIATIEKKVTAVKSNIPAAEEKKYFAALSDIENRKNSLKMMLKTPAEKRDAEWQSKWDDNYTKAIDKLSKLQ